MDAEALATRYRLNAVRDRWIPRLERAPAQLTLAIEEQERSDAARLRLAAGSPRSGLGAPLPDLGLHGELAGHMGHPVYFTRHPDRGAAAVVVRHQAGEGHHPVLGGDGHRGLVDQQQIT